MDDIRQQVDADSFLDDEQEEEQVGGASAPAKPEANRRFLGMTPAQRFVIAFLLLLLTCLFSSLCLLASGRVVPISF